MKSKAVLLTLVLVAGSAAPVFAAPAPVITSFTVRPVVVKPGGGEVRAEVRYTGDLEPNRLDFGYAFDRGAPGGQQMYGCVSMGGEGTVSIGCGIDGRWRPGPLTVFLKVTDTKGKVVSEQSRVVPLRRDTRLDQVSATGGRLTGRFAAFDGGKRYKPAARRTLRLLARRPGTKTWIELPPVKTGADGRFKAVLKPGGGRLRVVYPGSSWYARKVKELAETRDRTKVSGFTATPARINQGKKITFRGRFSARTALQGRPIELLFRPGPDVAPKVVRTVRTGKGGAFTAKLTARTTGTWFARFAGTGRDAPSRSADRRVLVGPASGTFLPSDDLMAVRTDFSSAKNWAAVKKALVPRNGDVSPAYVDDKAFRGLSVKQLMARLPVGYDGGLLVIVDRRAMTTRAHELLVVDLWEEPGRTLRVVASEYEELQANVVFALTLEFSDYVDAAGADGVFRGFG
ncbi:hypothetical protein GCM10027589_47980 [Actinocorallia lasiicapitis]